MADTYSPITPHQEPYEDLQHTKFPVAEDTFHYMKDISQEVMTFVTQYNNYFAQGNLTACNNLFKNNPELLDYFFNAEKWNQLRDAILAVERYYLNDVTEFIYHVAQNAIGVSDNPTEEQLATTAYPAGKINALLEELKGELQGELHSELSDMQTTMDSHKQEADAKIDKINNVIIVNLPAASWSAAAPYVQTVSVESITEQDIPLGFLYIPEGATPAQEKALKKAAGCISYFDTAPGAITVTCIGKKPAVDFQIQLKGVK